ncbi:hypothetical protein [Pedobacter sp. ASV28]|uniref:hypothetical protein n=1 Tax=Pedobacter sp. ASV28 TaxID=2795123 RepID=UPI0018EC605F|nr:hypothetical protein [Pedobacter sp. ASV28]
MIKSFNKLSLFLLAIALILGINVSAQVTVSTVAGNGTAAFLDGTGTAARLWTPWAVVVDSQGNVFVGEEGGKRIRKITPTGVVTTLAGNGTSAFLNGTGTAAAFFSPLAMAIDKNDNLYVCDITRIRKVTPAGVVTTFAGNGVAQIIDGPAAQASFSNLSGITIDVDGNLYVSDNYISESGDNEITSIRKITPAGMVSTFSTAVYYPANLTTDASKNLYVVDGDDQIIKITPLGVASTYIASGTFGTPLGLAMHSSGNLYVSISGNNRIYKVSPTKVAKLVAGTGAALPFTDGSGTTATFNYPTGLAFNASSELYVADPFNHRIRKVIDLSVLPVAFTSLNAQLSASNQLQVQWQTTSEANNKQFVVQASVNGSSWTNLGTVASKAANGNSSEVIAYTATYQLGQLALAGIGFLGFLFLPVVRNRMARLAMIVLVVAMAASCAKQNDSFADLKVQSKAGQSIYVRVAQVDYNGTTTYSDPIVVKGK